MDKEFIKYTCNTIVEYLGGKELVNLCKSVKPYTFPVGTLPNTDYERCGIRCETKDNKIIIFIYNEGADLYEAVCGNGCKNKGEKICDLYGDMLQEEFFNQTGIKINANPPELWSEVTSW